MKTISLRKEIEKELHRKNSIDKVKIQYNNVKKVLKKKFNQSKIIQGLIMLLLGSTVMVILGFKFTQRNLVLLISFVTVVNFILLYIYSQNESELKSLSSQIKTKVNEMEIAHSLFEPI